MTELFKMLGLALVFMYLINGSTISITSFTVYHYVYSTAGIYGGLLALWLAGMSVSVIAMIGFVMLSGIIVNNGIVFIDYKRSTDSGRHAEERGTCHCRQDETSSYHYDSAYDYSRIIYAGDGSRNGSRHGTADGGSDVGGLIYGTILTLVVVPCIFSLFHKREKARLVEEMEDN